MGSDRRHRPTLLRRACFNPRPRMGSDRACRHQASTIRIGCFNPRPRMGSDARPVRDVKITAFHCFNPRPRMGSDMSIQAVSAVRLRFNPRPRMGSDACTFEGKCALTGVFQSTPPHGERRRFALDGSREGRVPCFNPRPRMGSDHCPYAAPKRCRTAHVSIHAPAWGATKVSPGL